LFCPIFLFGQKNQFDSRGKKDGPWEQTYDDGTLKYSGTFENGTPVGVFKRYYEDGSLQAVIEHRSSDQSFAKLYYPETEQLMAEGLYTNQLKDSVWNFYSEENVLTSRETYSKGIKEGISEVYYADGSISERAVFEDGKKNGLWEQFFNDGKPKLKATVVDGVKYDGQYTTYYPNGRKLEDGKYVDGKKESSWYHYNENGSIHIIYVYRDDEVEEEYPKNGTFELYWDNDIKRAEYTYENGKKDGPFKEWFNQGEWRNEERTDEYGNRYPIQKLYGTQLSREGKYKEGELHGEIISYSPDGSVKSREVYETGVLVD
jgi:antitoxin component YwqK of YwqJK toxin-antitoxin module